MKAIFEFLRKISGGKLIQKQVDATDHLIATASADDVADMLGVAIAKENMTLSKNGIDLIAGFEGFESKAYLCPAGVWTIGFGTTVINGVRVKKGDTCTLEQAKDYKAQDLKRFEKTVNDAVMVGLTQNQFDALVSLTYNIGSNAFSNSTLLKKLNTGDYDGAADQFDVWNKAGGRVLKGLVNRRATEKKLFLK